MVYFTIRSSLLSSLLMMFFLFGVPSYASTQVVDVNTICNLTHNPSFCSDLLNSKPGADLQTLGQYSYDVLLDNVTNTISLINQLSAKGNQDLLAKYHYGYCLGCFISAKSDIEYAQNLVKSKDYRYLRLVTEEIMISTTGCQTIPPYYNDSSMLPKYAEVIEQVAEINRVILTLLGII